MNTLEDIEMEIDLVNKRLRHLEEQRLKLEAEIGDLNTKLNRLSIQMQRLKNLPGGMNS